eukprot:11890390-Alexandrium_andersonii.AAC.1
MKVLQALGRAASGTGPGLIPEFFEAFASVAGGSRCWPGPLGPHRCPAGGAQACHPSRRVSGDP